ncbi:MAG TPA: MoaD/ThiS family protein [Gemmataceae bacterium]|jgi:hypothetical protein|nr:MoaD/ThiS family protein [Gemmataceae bacterium]
MEESATVTVEFYGMPRQRAGRAELVVHAGAVADVLVAVKSACDGLSDLTREDGILARHYLLSINGDGFVTDVKQVLEPGTRLLLLSADAGG